MITNPQLRGVGGKRVHIRKQSISELAFLIKLVNKNIGTHHQGIAGHLDYDLMRRLRLSQKYRNTNHTFITYVANLYCLALGSNRQQRSQALINEINALDVVFSGVEHLVRR